MPQVGTSYPHGHDLQRAARDKLAAYPLQLAAQSGESAGGKLSLSCDRPNIQGQHSQLSMKGANKTMGEEWSNNACRGYVIKAMENCGFHAKEIQQVLTELYEVFDFCAVEEAADYFENWQSCPRANLARSVEKDERTAPFSWCRPFVFPHRDNAGNMLAVNPL